MAFLKKLGWFMVFLIIEKAIGVTDFLLNAVNNSQTAIRLPVLR